MSDRISFRLSPEALANLQAFTQATGKKPSEIARAGLEIYMAQCGWRIQSNLSDMCQTNGRAEKVPNVGHVSDNSHARTCDTNLDLSKDKSSSPTDDKKQAVQVWFKKFWVNCDTKMFPKRVVKTISDHWEDLSELCPEETCDKFNDYCRKQELKGRHPKHPNSWLTDGGYENETNEDTEGGLAYDIE